MRRVQTTLVATILEAAIVLTAPSLTAPSLTRADDPFRVDDVGAAAGNSANVARGVPALPAGGDRGVSADAAHAAGVFRSQTANDSRVLFGQTVPKSPPDRAVLSMTRNESASRGAQTADVSPAAVNPFLHSDAAPAPPLGEGSTVRAGMPVDDVPRKSARGFSFTDDPAASHSAAARLLTEAIPTSPVTAGQQSPAADTAAPVREANPFAGAEFAPLPAPGDEPALLTNEDPDPSVAPGDSLRRPSIESSPTFDAPPIAEAPAPPVVEAPAPPVVEAPAPPVVEALTRPFERTTLVSRSPAPVSRTYAHDATIVTAAWRTKGPFNVGQECPCEIVVKNQCGTTAEQVRVETTLPPSLRIVDSVPPSSEHEGVLSWQLKDLAPGEQQTIKVLVLADRPGPVEVAAHVRYTASQVQSLTVAEPKLEVALNGPIEVSVGEPASQTVVIHNPGTGVATNIVLEAEVPAGLEHVSGRDLVMQIGSLNPGETRQFRLTLAAVADGPQILQVEARTASGLVEKATAKVNVLAPRLTAGIDGPGLRYLGREATYVLRVENEGPAATDAVQMMYYIPEGFEFLRSDRGAQFDETTRTLRWFVGRIGSHQPQELHVTLLATQAGEFVQKVLATSEHGSGTEAQITTRVEGTASLVMKVADLDDPIEIGTDTAYEVTITNEGTASAQQIVLACQMPKGLAFVQAAGPTTHHMEANTLQFHPIATLPAGESVKYRLHVRGTAAGDKRFRCRLTSTELSQPLFTEESTKFYGELTR